MNINTNCNTSKDDNVKQFINHHGNDCCATTSTVQNTRRIPPPITINNSTFQFNTIHSNIMNTVPFISSPRGYTPPVTINNSTLQSNTINSNMNTLPYILSPHGYTPPNNINNSFFQSNTNGVPSNSSPCGRSNHQGFSALKNNHLSVPATSNIFTFAPVPTTNISFERNYSIPQLDYQHIHGNTFSQHSSTSFLPPILPMQANHFGVSSTITNNLATRSSSNRETALDPSQNIDLSNCCSSDDALNTKKEQPKKKKQRKKYTPLDWSSHVPLNIDGIDRKVYNTQETTKSTSSSTMKVSSVHKEELPTSTNDSEQEMNLQHQITTSLQSLITNTTKEMESSSSQVLLFTLYDPDGIELKNCDLFRYKDKSIKPNDVYKLYFSKEEYPSNNGFRGHAWNALKTHLNHVCGHAGFQISISRTKNNTKTFHCTKGTIYRGNFSKRWSLSYRNFSASNDALNSRGSEGRSLARKSKVSSAISKEDRCKLNFVIAFDSVGFYVAPGKGCNEHCNHMVMNNIHGAMIPDRCITIEQNELARKVADGGLKTDSVNAVVFKDTGKGMNRMALRYHTKTKFYSHSEKGKSFYCTDEIFNLLQKKKLPYITLSSNLTTSEDKLHLVYERNGVHEGSHKSSVNDAIEYILNNTSEGTQDAMDYVKEKWKLFELGNNQQLLVAFAWTSPLQIKLFESNPEVIFVDTTKDTNNEKRPLLTITGMDSNGKMFYILHAFLPHERGWIFDWIFQVVMPSLFPDSVLKKVKIIFSDGDSREIAAIDSAILKIFIFAIRARCDWHIVDRGWYRRGPRHPRSNNAIQKKNYMIQEAILKKWMYSWSKPQCETEGEFKLSFYLFMKYINSQELEEKMGSLFVNELKVFVREYLQGALSDMLFYKRKGIRHFHLHSSVVHEGTNRQIKHGAYASCKRDALYTTTTNIIGIQATKEDRLYTDICRNTLKTNTWSNLPFSEGLSVRGFELLKKQYDSKDMYRNIRTKRFKWKVRMDINHVAERSKQVHPSFDRLRTVVYEDNVFKCSCELFEECGYMCRHILNVWDSFPVTCTPCQKDISCIYWKMHDYLVLVEHKNNEKLKDLFEQLKCNDVKGPSCPIACFDSIPIVDEKNIPDYFKINGSVCLNYKLTNVTDEQINSTFQPVGMLSQVISDYESNEETNEVVDEKINTVYNVIDETVIKEAINLLSQVIGDTKEEEEEVDSANIQASFMENVELCSQDLIPKRKKNAYDYLKTTFGELCRHCEAFSGDDEVLAHADKLMKDMIPQLTQKFKHKLPQNKGKEGRFVTSNFVTKSQSTKHVPCRKY